MLENQYNGRYQTFLEDVKERIKAAQYRALRAINAELVPLYWDIGRLIVEKQAEHGWGNSVVEKLSADLRAETPNLQGFSVQNLWYMRQFYTTYKDLLILQPLVGEIGWANNVVIFSKCKDAMEREFYLLHTRKFGWTKAVLTHQIENKTYEKYLLNQTNFDEILPETYKHNAILAVKDHYTFDFLDLAEQHEERDLERALIKNVRSFLAEMGSNFTFVDSQYKLTVGGQDYFLDLLLYHRQLQCLVVIELKIGDFKPEYKGKMEFYLAVLNDTVKLPHERDAIGIIICKNKNRTIVEYA